MSNSIKKILLTVLLTLSVVMVTMGMTAFGIANADTRIITINDTASCKIDQTLENSGLRFTANIDKEPFENLYSNYDTVEAGIIIVPTDFVEKAGGHTLDKLTTLSELQGKTYYQITPDYRLIGDSYEFDVSIKTIKDFNYNRDFTGVAFIKITDSDAQTIEGFAEFGGAYYQYSDAHSTNVYDVAYSAYEDRRTTPDEEYKVDLGGGVYGKLDVEEYDIIKNYLDGVAVISDNDGRFSIANNDGEYYTSPYTIEVDERGNNVLLGNGLKGLNYNEERIVDYYKTTEDFQVYVPQRGSITEIDASRMATLMTYTSGLTSTTTHAFQYIGWKGEYGVGTYLDFEFSGNNMPQVMFFADSIDGYMCAGKSGTDTSGMRKGVIVMSGTSSERLNRMYVIGPNRVRTDQTASDKTTTYAFSDGAPLHAKLTLYGETTTSYTGTTYPLLTQKGLTEAGEEKSYKYTIGTYEAEGEKLGIHIILTYADGEAIYDIRKATTLNVSDLTADNIVVYPPIKGNGTSTFKFSAPYIK